MKISRDEVIKMVKYWWVLIGIIGTALTIILILDQGWNIWTQILVWASVIGGVAIVSRLPYWRLQTELSRIIGEYNKFKIEQRADNKVREEQIENYNKLQEKYLNDEREKVEKYRRKYGELDA